jgi:hypothetical protein
MRKIDGRKRVNGEWEGVGRVNTCHLLRTVEQVARERDAPHSRPTGPGRNRTRKLSTKAKVRYIGSPKIDMCSYSGNNGDYQIKGIPADLL